MTSFQFLSANGKINVVLKCDLAAIAKGNKVLTVMDISGWKTQDGTDASKMFSTKWKRGTVSTIDDIIAFAVANNLKLVAVELGGANAAIAEAAVALLAPAIAAANGAGHSVLTITDATANYDVTYTVQRATNAIFTTGVTNLPALTGVAKGVYNDNVAAGTYYYRVKAVGPNAADSAWSAASAGAVVS